MVAIEAAQELFQRCGMDKGEAERLAMLIERTRVEWIQVRGIEQSPLTGKYELNCHYRRDRALNRWTELRIRSPR